MAGKTARTYHFIAIGGSIMHSLALALHRSGHSVTGSDDAINDPAKNRLQAAGLLPAAEGWFPDKLHAGIDMVVLGMHARADNPELKRAQELGLRVLSFPEFMYEHSRHKQRIVIAGSHGKTTVTSMVMHVLKASGTDFDYMVGAAVPGFDHQVRLTEDAPIIVLEGDEYTTSPLDLRPKFLHYHAHIVVITGIAWDHINVFPTEEGYIGQFAALMQALPKAGTCIYNKDDRALRELAALHLIKEFHYPVPYAEPVYRYRDGKMQLKADGTRYTLNLIGGHNASNAMAAAEVCLQLGLEMPEIMQHLATYKGAARRLEVVYESADLVVIRDFAHAPSKVKASVAAVVEAYKDRFVTAVLELHTYSSMNRDFLPNYKASMKKAHSSIVAADPQAFELKKMAPLTEKEIVKAFGDRYIKYVSNKAELLAATRATLKGKRVLLLMSSGPLLGAQPADFLA